MSAQGSPEGFEILEHTADIGVRAAGPTVESVFAAAARGMVHILGVEAEDEATQATERIDLEGSDLGGLLVDWLNELLFIVDARESAIGDIRVLRASETTGVRAEIDVVAGAGPPRGTELKAATYHQLSVERTANGYTATVYFDV